MTRLSQSELDHRYSRLFYRRSAYIPATRAEFDESLVGFQARLAACGDVPMQPSVAAFAALLETDGVARMYTGQMIEQASTQTVTSIPGLLTALNQIITSAPVFVPKPQPQNFFPMSTLFTYMMMTTPGEAAFRYTPINDALRHILKAWCAYLDSPASRSVITYTDGWLSPAAWVQYKLDEFIIPDPGAPHGGFTSFNAFFHRQIKPHCRPIAGPGDPSVITSANDGSVYAIARGVKLQDQFWLKGQPYSLSNMLAGSPFTNRFVGGDVFQSFLSGANYHRWRAPISGVVREARVVNGLMFSDLEALNPDPTAATFSQGYEASVNTRGLVFIESPVPGIGMVCVMPIGITEISSVVVNVHPGDYVEKGDELGWFSYGGSTLALVFQPGAVAEFTVPGNDPIKNPDSGPPINVNQQLALANM